jgi:hypothetical protein
VKRFSKSAVALLVILLSRPAGAQIPVQFQIGAGIAIPVPPGVASDSWNAGYTLSAATRDRISNRFTFGVDAEYAHFERNDDNGPGTAGRCALFLVPVYVTSEFALREWGNTRPFLLGNLGYVHVGSGAREASVDPAAAADVRGCPRDDGLVVGLGAGVRTLLTASASLFLDASWRFALATTDRISWVPVRVGVRF